MEVLSALEYARKSDQNDPLAHWRDHFHIPKDGKAIYLCGNSLGLQPKTAFEHIKTELDAWKDLGVEGHFSGKNPWADYHWFLKSSLSKITGALEEEVVVMNSLTANLHSMMVSFYQPKDGRYKILMEASAFPSDQYAMETQVRYHGYDPEEAIIELKPREGEHTLRTEDIYDTIEQYAEEIALVMMPGVQYYTGQYFDIGGITEFAQKHGIKTGWDLAHAIGNLPMKLHEWGPDFAVWCSYKYLNSGPGGVGGLFVHQRHANNPDLPRFAGWWGHKEEERFQMKKGFIPMKGADGWQLSNKNVLSLAAQKASLDLFEKVGVDALREKSIKLTAYLEGLIGSQLNEEVEIITPHMSYERGCQLSLIVKNGKEVFKALTENHVIADWREPDVIRVAPAPFYNTFEEVYTFVQIMKSVLKNEQV